MSKRKDFCQEIFWKGKEHLITQNQRCFDPITGRCKLRFENLKCVAGAFIPDSDYFPEMEKTNFYEFFDDSGYLQSEKDLIEKMQVIHDFTPVKDWINELKTVAKICNLNFENPNK